ncbi:MAG: hypothetical protein M0D54_17140 [Hyphomonadaceae bacterium JAD_PAG50586_4]|nr:MAG: hypothetical protein M0D54_17140 [Hyphomonadaceae bacterium JAD_PAG50586_4]
MRLALALGVAVAALTVAAYAANPDRARIHIRHAGAAMISYDANEDGWLTRDEAAAAADATFVRLDSNNDGRLDQSDRRDRIHIREHGVEMRIDGGLDGEVTVIENGVRTTRRLTAEERERIERNIAEAERHREHAELMAEQAEEQAEQAAEHAERAAERIAEHAERVAELAAERAERRAEMVERHIARTGDHHERHVIIIRGDGDEAELLDGDFVAPVPPMAPMPPMPVIAPLPPHPPMFMMAALHNSEADTNNDGALSREEFRAQQLRFFDANDANGDGRVQFEPPEAPAPPQAPEPPTPPHRR